MTAWRTTMVGVFLGIGIISRAMETTLRLSQCEEIASDNEVSLDEDEILRLPSCLSQALKVHYFDQQSLDDGEYIWLSRALRISSEDYFGTQQAAAVMGNQGKHLLLPKCINKLLHHMQHHDFTKIMAYMNKLANCQNCLKKINENIGKEDKTILSHALVELGKIEFPKITTVLSDISIERYSVLDDKCREIIKNIRSIIVHLRRVGADDKKARTQILGQEHKNLFAYHALTLTLDSYE